MSIVFDRAVIGKEHRTMHTPVLKIGRHCQIHGQSDDEIDSKCHLLMLSDEIILNIFRLLPVTSRLNAAGLHSRLQNVVQESWKQVHHFPSERVGFRFHKDKRRVVTVEHFLPVLLQCKNVRILRLPNAAGDSSRWYEMGWQVGSRCLFIEKLVGQFNDIEFVLGIVEAMHSTGRVPHLTEISVRELRSLEEIHMLDKVAKGSPDLRTCRILINSLSSSLLLNDALLLQLREMQQRLKSFIIPQSLSSRIMNY